VDPNEQSLESAGSSMAQEVGGTWGVGGMFGSVE
jgi:hypothetical protein